MPNPIVVGNWKMNTNLAEALTLASGVVEGVSHLTRVDKVICPPFVSIASVKEILHGSPVMIGAQNMHYEERGAYTGEVSANMVAELCQYVILGHSERRQIFHETDELVNKKVKSAISVGLNPILCIGENLVARESLKTIEVIELQLRSALSGLESLRGLSVAYEPIWAIGTGMAATGGDSAEVIRAIRNILSDLYGESEGSNVQILYGGSVTEENASEYSLHPDINGVLLGGASLQIERFVRIVQILADN